MKYKRFNLSEFIKIRDEEEISGNFTSVRGEYYIPFLSKTGFYKVNGCMNNAKNDEDLRELLASHILDEIGFPHADIVPIFDDTHNCNGCLSLNILKNGETFAIPQSIPHEKSFSHVGEFISHDLKEVSSLSGITEKDLKERNSLEEEKRKVYDPNVLFLHGKNKINENHINNTKDTSLIKVDKKFSFFKNLFLKFKQFIHKS